MTGMLKWLNTFVSGSWGKAQNSSEQVPDIAAQLAFARSEPLTLGVEFELAMLDCETLQPKPCGEAVIDAANNPYVKKELFRHMVEVTTGICKDVHEAKTQLTDALCTIIAEADRQGAVVIGSGRPPTLKCNELERVEDERYAWLKEQRQIINDRFGTLGMHVHIGMTDADACVRYHNFYTHFIPHLLALSAASPFEEGEMTGLASARALVTESLPVGGIPYHYKTWQEYVDLVTAMAHAGSIRNLKDMWWDIRPSPQYGTLELRICDQPSNMQEAMAIVAFVHLIGKWFSAHQDWLDEMPRPEAWRLRENKWRAIRYGIGAELIVNAKGDVRPIADDITTWLERVTPYVEELGYQEYVAHLREMLERGNSAQRQQRLHAAGWSNAEVSRYLARTMSSMKPLHEEVEEVVRKVEAQKTLEEQPILMPPSAIAACFLCLFLFGLS